MKHTNSQQQEQRSAKGGTGVGETWRSDFPLRAGWHPISASWKARMVQKKTSCTTTRFQSFKFFNVGGQLPGNKVFALGMSTDCERESFRAAHVPNPILGSAAAAHRAGWSPSARTHASTASPALRQPFNQIPLTLLDGFVGNSDRPRSG